MSHVPDGPRPDYATKEDLEKLAIELRRSLASLEQMISAPIGDITHQVETIKFPNLEGKTVHDLTVNFGEKGVKTKNPGPFRKAVSEERGGGTRVTLSKGQVEKDKTADITFERDGAFEVATWWWTDEKGNKVGETKTGSPDK